MKKIMIMIAAICFALPCTVIAKNAQISPEMKALQEQMELAKQQLKADQVKVRADLQQLKQLRQQMVQLRQKMQKEHPVTTPES